MKSSEDLQVLLSQLENFVTAKTVIGEPITMGETTILPVVDVSFGVAVGAKDKRYDRNGLACAGGGTGAKMSPSAILVVKGNDVRLVNIKNQDAVTRLLDMVPDVIDRVQDGIAGFKKEKENKKAREAVEASMADDEDVKKGEENV